jgi:hypothetical protein
MSCYIMALTSTNFILYVQIHKPIRGFRKGPPDNLKELAVMFEVYDEENETPAPSPVQQRPKRPAPPSCKVTPSWVCVCKLARSDVWCL